MVAHPGVGVGTGGGDLAAVQGLGGDGHPCCRRLGGDVVDDREQLGELVAGGLVQHVGHPRQRPASSHQRGATLLETDGQLVHGKTLGPATDSPSDQRLCRARER